MDDIIRKYRIVNINYTVDGMRFDAAVDCDWQMHCYDLDLWGGDTAKEEKSKKTPVELYCFDKKDWDIRMVYIEGKNDQIDIFEPRDIHRSLVDFDKIIEETKSWIAEMAQKGE